MRAKATPEIFVPASAEQVLFRDGMIVTAEDLEASMRYPLQLMQVVNRAYFGCGVICGFELSIDPALGEHTVDCSDCKRRAVPSFVIRVHRGVALGCDGLPIELCRTVELDLSPDPCACDDPPRYLCIAVRRDCADDGARAGGDCGCGTGRCQYSRKREQIQIKAFAHDALPDSICRRFRPAEPGGNEDDCGCDDKADDQQQTKVVSPAVDICSCLTSCDNGCACGDSWVLIGCVELCDKGIVVDAETKKPHIDQRARRWVKPIECHCRREEVRRKAFEKRDDPQGENPPDVLLQQARSAQEQMQKLDKSVEEIINDDTAPGSSLAGADVSQLQRVIGIGTKTAAAMIDRNIVELTHLAALSPDECKALAADLQQEGINVNVEEFSKQAKHLLEKS